MNRIWWKRITAIVVFLVSLFVIDFILNRDNSEITTDMPKATLPVVSVMSENYKINTMYGYTSKREEAYTKNSITPISEKREITIIIDTYQADIDSVAYEVRSIDGERLIENGDVSVLQKMPDQIRFTIQLKDLIEENKEYAFVTILTLEGGEKAYYYNRFIQCEKFYAKEKLDFISNFHNMTFGEDGTELKKYLESNAKGDNSTFHKVDIHSSLAQAMWDTLSTGKCCCRQKQSGNCPGRYCCNAESWRLRKIFSGRNSCGQGLQKFDAKQQSSAAVGRQFCQYLFAAGNEVGRKRRFG